MSKENIQKKLFIANIVLIAGFLAFVGTRSIIARQIIVDVPTHPDGTLIKVADKNGIYALDEGFKHYIPSPQIFESRYHWRDVVTVSENELNSYPTGDHILFRDGTLISDKDKVYIIEHGFKRPISSPETFEKRGYRWENVKRVRGENILKIHPTGDVVFTETKRTDGDLIKTADSPRIYVLDSGKRRLIPSPLVLESRYRWKDMVTISEQEMVLYPIGDTISFPDGMLLKDDNSVYVIEDAKKRPVAHAKDFDDLGYKWNNVIKPTDYQFVLGLYPTGEMITSR